MTDRRSHNPDDEFEVPVFKPKVPDSADTTPERLDPERPSRITPEIVDDFEDPLIARDE